MSTSTANPWSTCRKLRFEYLLATKLLASRVSRDEDDIVLLYEMCGLTTVEEGLRLVERYYAGRPIEAKVRYYLEELLEARGLGR